MIILSGHNLTPDDLTRIADGAPVGLAEAGLTRMVATHAQLRAALAEERPIYGVTTGLGPRVVERLDADAQAAMSLRTVRGRAHTAGAPLPARIVRGAMAVRANTLLIGASGARPDLARLIAACLDAGLSPVVRTSGSIGAADLMWGGSLGRGLIGESDLDTPLGVRPAAEALAAAGLAPYAPGPREGLAMVSHSSFAGALAALAVTRLTQLFEAAQTAAALSLEGFRGNLSPLDPHALALRPQAGQTWAAEGLRQRLAGSSLWRAGTARRLQDPLSLRNIAQIHGAFTAALETLAAAASDEINGASDNPAVHAETGVVLSHGGYLTPHLAITANAVAQAAVHVAAAQVSRMAKMVNPRFTDLPLGLVAGGVDSAGFAPVMKTAEALFAEIAHHAQPSPVYPSFSADGVEDVVAHSAVPLMALEDITERLDRLVAIELIIAAQALDLRAPDPVAPAMARTRDQIRTGVAPLTEDRSLTDDIEWVATRIQTGLFGRDEPV
ncbi:MAG: aromatic amino acid lyase [Pseudomonadota bacterium]